ncbi:MULTISPECIES: VOC family protein [Halocynthiibacter]|uniref:VOC family protein n=1 Tax=Halocynthiibacter halioticoli TaxID=2986804 RepID=A0AAE3LSE4_9RHOB|nr:MULTISPECIES: VOC family protein [Halocynthiibacter]MCV6823331.1 VOC family protein [Halocynthiibacter halioticoli]MCW4056332.1 VOC family protein [Halocynthiibacter sp. SDUM655004]
MAVRRIVANIKTDKPSKVQTFYKELFDLTVLMDFEWIITLGTDEHCSPQISLMNEGGSGAPVPDLSIEVDDVNATFARAKELGFDIVYDLTDEPWGVRRFFVTDPTGKSLNILSHTT